MIWRFGTHSFDLSRRALIVGIINVTPDSFSDGGAFIDPEVACSHGLKLLEEGADLLDLGGESTRPRATPVSSEEELRRILPVVTALRAKTSAPLSIDTSKAAVAKAALEAGADIINDVTALRGDLQMGQLVAAHHAGLILMHMQGIPETMQENPSYPEDDVLTLVSKFLSERRAVALGCGVDASAIIFDPGLGFGKTMEQNLALLRGIPILASLGAPLMIGHSRKSFLGSLSGHREPIDRLWPGVAVTTLARSFGARLFRVHDISPHREALCMTEAILAPCAPTQLTS
jgi:dihydropteroate synthase